MKLTSTLTKNSGEVINTSVILENCSLGQAITMIESWCYDNGADYPRTCDIWKNNGLIQVSIKTKDHNYINIFDIED
jgi:hypothetical protein